MIKGVIAIVALLLLTGCVAMQQREAMAAAAQRNALCESSARDPRLDSLRAQYSPDARASTLPQLTDERMPTSEQKAALAAIPDVFAQCTQATVAILDKYSAPGASNVYLQFVQDSKLLAAAFWSGKMNFGQFNTARVKLDSDTRANIARLEQHAYDIARAEEMQRAQTAALLAPYFLQAAQPAPYIAPPLTTTNCYKFGNQVSCHSY